MVTNYNSLHTKTIFFGRKIQEYKQMVVLCASVHNKDNYWDKKLQRVIFTVLIQTLQFVVITSVPWTSQIC